MAISDGLYIPAFTHHQAFSICTEHAFLSAGKIISLPYGKSCLFLKFFSTIFYFKIFDLGKALFGSNKV
jgi:hypothetical protein